MPRHLHSFTLWPKAAEYVRNTRRGKKSQMVSRSIEWFNKPQDFIVKEYSYESTAGGEGWPGDLAPGTKTYTRKIRALDLSELVEANEQLQKRFTEVCIELQNLKNDRSFKSKVINLFKR
jgi:hypothetical protein|tara:strand:- start:888 stop:1247 length:360 start_codon:yes stop_codon:yes gene_type:complete